MTNCEPCQHYLQTNRTRLLPHLGRTVATTGRPPAHIINDLLTKYHQLGHPTPQQTTPQPPPTDALKALQRIANATRTREHGTPASPVKDPS